MTPAERIRLYTRIVTKLTCSVRAEGLENIPPKGPLVVVGNHLSWADPMVAVATIPRHVVFFAKEELWRLRWLAWAGREHEDILIRRGEADRQAIREGEDRLNRGIAVAILPEGTRSRNDKLGPGQPGAAFLALRKGVPILPYGITGAERLRKPVDFLTRPRIVMRFGEPFLLDPALRRDLPSATEQIMRSIAALLPDAYRGVYAD